jgi:hypothetical protein
MRAMGLRLLATATLLALTAAPAALAKGSVTIGSDTLKALRAPHTTLVTVSVTKKKDTLRSCQAGDRRSHVRTSASPLGETQRQAATVACEQPPRSELNFSNGMKHAQSAALAAAG